MEDTDSDSDSDSEEGDRPTKKRKRQAYELLSIEDMIKEPTSGIRHLEARNPCPRVESIDLEIDSSPESTPPKKTERQAFEILCVKDIAKPACCRRLF